jgi:hypothetical protein
MQTTTAFEIIEIDAEAIRVQRTFDSTRMRSAQIGRVNGVSLGTRHFTVKVGETEMDAMVSKTIQNIKKLCFVYTAVDCETGAVATQIVPMKPHKNVPRENIHGFTAKEHAEADAKAIRNLAESLKIKNEGLSE